MGKLIILHTILLFGLVALYFTGALTVLLNFDHVYAIPLIGGLIGLGSLLAALKRWEDVEWLADKLPVCGLIMTVLGLLVTAQGVLGTDLSQTKDLFLSGAIGALVGNMMGAVGWGWLLLLRKMCHEL